MADRFLYLDDIRTPLDPGWEVVRTYEEFTAAIKLNGLGSYSHISLDHDLGHTAMVEYYSNVKPNYELNYSNIEEKTGYDAAKFLVNESIETNIPLPQVYVHSANPIGSANIMGYINNYYKNCKRQDSCLGVNIEHIVEEHFRLTPEERLAKYKRVSPCVGHSIASDEEEEALNRRMDIIAQNGNEGLHYEADSWMDEYKDDYQRLVSSGMFWEFHPDWTGVWDKDKYVFCHEQRSRK
jgi:hypothetical protein